MSIFCRYFVTVRRATFMPLLLEFADQVVVAQRVGLVFAVDQFLQLDPDGVPGHIVPVVAAGATDEEPLEREACRAASGSTCRPPRG